MSTNNVSPQGPVDYREVQESGDFKELKKTHRSFVFPMAVIFLIWYLIYVLFAAFLPDFMATSVWGNINIGIIFGLLQFVSTFLITWAYVHFANTKFDPKASKIRHELEAAGVGLPDEEPAQQAPQTAEAKGDN